MSSYQKYIFRKIRWYLLTLVVALSLNFFLPRMIKGNPVSMIAGKMTAGMTDADTIKHVYATFSKEFGLDKPKYMQF